MKKYKLCQTIVLLIFVLSLGIIASIWNNEIINDTVFFILFGAISVVFIGLANVLENKIQKLKAEEERVRLALEKEENKKLLFTRSQINNILNLMYELYNGHNSTINELLTQYDLVMDYYYDEEEKEDWFSIESKVYKKKQFYSISFSNNGDMYLNDEEINVSTYTEEEILNIIIKDINDFFNME